MGQTIEEALGAGPWYGKPRVAYLNDAGDLVLLVRRLKDADDVHWTDDDDVDDQLFNLVFGGVRPAWITESISVVRGTDAEKIDALRCFEDETERLIAAEAYARRGHLVVAK